MSFQRDRGSRVPPALAAPILEQHGHLRTRLDHLERLAQDLRRGKLDAHALRAALLELSVDLLSHFESEQSTLAELTHIQGRPSTALDELQSEHEAQRRNLDRIATEALSPAASPTALADLADRLVGEVREDMDREEKWVWSGR